MAKRKTRSKAPVEPIMTMERARIIERIREEHPNLLTDSPETIELRQKLQETARLARIKYPETFVSERKKK